MSTNKVILTGGVAINQTKDITPEELAPNNYLTIVWKDSTGKFINTLDIDNKSAIQYTNDLNSAIDSAISNNNVTYAGQNKYINVESIAKYIAQNTIDAGTQRTVVNALIGLASGAGKRTPDNITNLMVNVFGNIADKTARELGFTDPHEVFSQVAGENVINVFKQLGNKTKDYLDNCISKINGRKKTDLTSNNSKTEKKYVGLLLGLTTNDTESYEITIPRKKVEDGSDYTTHLLPQHFKKDFTVKLTNKVLSEKFSQIDEITNIEFVKDKLIEIANSHTLFDVYIRLSADRIYKRANVFFTSLSFEKDESSGNGYTCTFSIEPVNNFKSKTFVSNKKYGNTGSKSSGSGNRKQNNKSNSGNPLNVTYIGPSSKMGIIKDGQTYKTREEFKKDCKQSGNYELIQDINNEKNIFYWVDKDAVTQINGVNVLVSDRVWVHNPLTGKSGWVIRDGGYVEPSTKNVYIGKSKYRIE